VDLNRHTLKSIFSLRRNKLKNVMHVVMAQPAAHQEGAQAQGEAQPLEPQAPKPPIVFGRRIRTRR
jgi:hypothetical protein